MTVTPRQEALSLLGLQVGTAGCDAVPCSAVHALQRACTAQHIVLHNCMQDGATAESVRRAFRQKALQFHPDKNLADPERAAEQFSILVRAYQRLANPSADQSWEDLDPAHILTDDFLNEALSQQLPPFELMYM